MAVFTQLEQIDFTGKKVFPVMTHEGSGLGSAERDLKRTCKGAKIVKGLAVQGSRIEESEQSVRDWVRKYLK
jgi:flavodoxin